MEKTAGPPSPLPPTGVTVNNILAAVASLSAMVSRLMGPTITEQIILDAERHIKLFLSAFNTFDKEMRTERSIPTWITSHNFICLTNLPSVMREFGPLQNLWEGGGQGEKALHLIKPSWNGYRKNWQLHIMNGMLQNMAIGRIKAMRSSEEQLNYHDNDSDDEAEQDLDEASKQISGNCYLYSNLTELHNAFNNQCPISILLLQNDTFISLLRTGMQCELTPTRRAGTLLGLGYHLWHISDGDNEGMVNTNDIMGYSLLLPKLT
jgi:hypothetical protein